MCKETLKEKLGSTDNCYSNKTAAEEKGRKFRLILPKGEEACRVNFSSVKQKFEKEFKRDYGKEIRISSSSPDWKVD